MNGRPWSGVRWIKPVNGICPRHETPVGKLTGLCALCHREQLEAAADGSYEWDEGRPESSQGDVSEDLVRRMVAYRRDHPKATASEAAATLGVRKADGLRAFRKAAETEARDQVGSIPGEPDSGSQRFPPHPGEAS